MHICRLSHQRCYDALVEAEKKVRKIQNLGGRVISEKKTEAKIEVVVQQNIQMGGKFIFKSL